MRAEEGSDGVCRKPTQTVVVEPGSVQTDGSVSRSQGYDLLRVGGVRRVIEWSGFPYVFQTLILVLVVGFALLGWGQHAPAGVPSKLYAKSNLVNLVIWGLWWPAMVWGAVWLGRIWCMVCPIELVSNLGERVGRAFKLPQGRLPGWIAAGGLIVLFYFIIQMCVAGLELHRVPAYTSVFLWTLLGLGLVTGLAWRDRAFCRGFCPVGLLLNVYGRGGMLAVRPKDPGPCRDCQGRECKVSDRRNAWDARSCPSLLNPSRLDSNRDCLLCTQCLKACRRHNLGLFWRRPFPVADRREPLASWPVVLFVMVVSGFVTYELCSEWKAAQAVFVRPPSAVAGWLGLSGNAGWLRGLWTLVLVPAVIWTVLGALTRLGGGARSLPEAWRRLALPLAVIISAGHMSKGLAKVASWGGFLPLALHEPLGVQTSRQLQAGTLPAPAHLLSLGTVSVVGLVLVVSALFFGLREARLADASGCRGRVPPLVVLGVFYLSLIAGWGLQ